MIASVAVEEALLILKIAFLVLLYLFIWRVVRTASRDLRLPQESFVLAPQQAARLLGGKGTGVVVTGKLVVLESPALETGEVHELDSSPMTVGRGDDNDVSLTGDEFASSRHARFEPRRNGVWIEDIGSTNGTYVNGVRVTKERRLSSGDVVRIGETDFRFER
jgi:hypothetical protein